MGDNVAYSDSNSNAVTGTSTTVDLTVNGINTSTYSGLIFAVARVVDRTITLVATRARHASTSTWDYHWWAQNSTTGDCDIADGSGGTASVSVALNSVTCGLNVTFPDVNTVRLEVTSSSSLAIEIGGNAARFGQQ